MTVDLDTFVTIVYCLIDDLYQEWIAPHKPVRRGPRPKLSDPEVLTLMLVAQIKGWSGRELVGNAQVTLASAFPQLLSQSQFNRRGRDLYGAFLVISSKVAELLGAASTAFELVDAMPLPLARRCRGQRHRLFAGEASIGRGGTDRPYYYGCQLLLATTADGVITGWVLGPAATEGRWLLDALLAWRENPEQPLWTPDDLPPSRHGRISVGPTGPRRSPDSAGTQHLIPYVADNGFFGGAWQQHWHTDHHAEVITCRGLPPDTPPVVTRQHRRRRLRIETVNAILDSALHIKFPKAKTYWGLLTMIAAKIATFNVARWVNDQLGRNPMQIKSLVMG